MHYNAFDMLFVAVSQDKENKEETTPAESDGNSSDYFADAETSSCGSFKPNDVFISNSEGKDAAEKGLTAKLFICLASYGLNHCWSSSGDEWDAGNISLVGQNESNLVWLQLPLSPYLDDELIIRAGRQRK